MARSPAYNTDVERFRDLEYPMLKGKTYLDHGGSTVYAKSLIERYSQALFGNLYGNPHSASDPARLTGETIDAIRRKALEFFKADPKDFDFVFTANATAAIKLVADGFHDLASLSTKAKTFWYGYHRDAHTSLIGVRELTKGTHHCFPSDGDVEDWLNGITTETAHKPVDQENIPGLFAFAGQSNMTGRRLPLSWIKRLRESNLPSHQNTYSLLDAAALATTTQLDFSDPAAAPDFTAISFYKIFGFPDVGGLIIRKNSGHILGWRRYFGGGTVNMVTVFHEASHMRRTSSLHDALEDGTLQFHSIIALGIAIDVHKQMYTSMTRISQHTTFLSARLYHSLRCLRHANGSPVCEIYADALYSGDYGDAKTQGATLAFNVLRANGSWVSYSVVEKRANDRKIYLRSGGLCNAGGIATYLEIAPWQFKRAWSQGHRCGARGFEILNGKPTGVVRASLGAMTTIQDIDTLVAFLWEEFVDLSNDVDQAKVAFSPNMSGSTAAISFREHEIQQELPRTHVSPVEQSTMSERRKKARTIESVKEWKKDDSKSATRSMDEQKKHKGFGKFLQKLKNSTRSRVGASRCWNR